MNSDSISSNQSSDFERHSSRDTFKSPLSENEKLIQNIASKEIKEKTKKTSKAESSKVPVERQRIPPAQENPPLQFPLPTEPPPLHPAPRRAAPDPWFKQLEQKIRERAKERKPYLLKQDVTNILAHSSEQFAGVKAFSAIKAADSYDLSLRRAIYYSIAEGFLLDRSHLLKKLASIHHQITLDKSALEFYCEVWRVLAEKEGAYTIDMLDVEKKTLPEKLPMEELRELAHESIAANCKNVLVELARENKIDDIASTFDDKSLLPVKDLPPKLILAVIRETQATLEAEGLEDAIPKVFEQFCLALLEDQEETFEKLMEVKTGLSAEFVAAADQVQVKERASPTDSTDLQRDIYERIKAGKRDRLTDDVKAMLSLISLDESKCRLIALALMKWASEEDDPSVRREIFQSFAKSFLPDQAMFISDLAKIDVCPPEFLQEAGKILAGFDRKFSGEILKNSQYFHIETAEQLLELLQIVVENDGTAVLDYLAAVDISPLYQHQAEEIKSRAISTFIETYLNQLPESIKQNNSDLIASQLPGSPLPSSAIQTLIQASVDSLSGPGMQDKIPLACTLLCEALMVRQKEALLRALDGTEVAQQFLRAAAKTLVLQDAMTNLFLLKNLDKFQLNESDLAEILNLAARQYPNTFVSLINELKLPERLSQLSSRIEVASSAADRKNKSWVLQNLDLFGITPQERPLFERHRAQEGDLDRLRTIVKKRVIPLAKGLSQEGTKLMHPFYWMEQGELKITIGNDTYQGHFNPKSFQQAYNKWQAEGYLKQYSFEDYLNQLYIPSLSHYELQELTENLHPVHYFNDEELATLAPKLLSDGSVQMPSGSLAQWTQYRQLGMTQEYNAYLATAPAPPDSTALPNGDYIFTVGSEGDFHIAWKAGNINHSSLTGGKPSRIAGTLLIEQRDGRAVINRVIPWSGHYQPDIGDLEDMRQFLAQQGVDTSLIEFQTDLDGKVILSHEQFKQKIDTEKSRLLSRIKGYSPAAYEQAKTFSLKQLQKLERDIPSDTQLQIKQLADQLYQHLEQVLNTLGYKSEEIHPFALVFASDLFPMLANPKEHQGAFTRSVKATERRFPGSVHRFEKVKIPFTFVSSLDRNGKKLHLQIIPDTKAMLGQGGYGKVKSTYTLNIEVSSEQKAGSIQIDHTVVKRIAKDRSLEVLATLSTVRQMAALVGSQARLVLPRMERDYDSKTQERRLELEMDRFLGSMGDVARKGYVSSLDHSTTPTLFDTGMRLSCLLDVAETIAAMHEADYLHLDLKVDNVLIKKEPDGSARAYTGDFDLLKKGIGAFRDHPTYPYYDRLGQKGIATPSCDLYGMVALGGELMIPDFYTQILQDRTKVYTNRGRTRYAAEMLTEKALKNLKLAGFREAELAPLLLLKQRILDKPETYRSELLADTLLRAMEPLKGGTTDEKKLRALQQNEKEVRAIQRIFDLYCEVSQAEQRWNKTVSSDPELQRKILTGTDSEKQEALDKMKTFFPNLMAADIARRIKEIHYTI
ncbi:MAG: hypothetical protein LLG04_02900 [Parachlamydia sp.]|nr:hypothetical protein [Parachlamydia sp.]